MVMAGGGMSVSVKESISWKCKNCGELLREYDLNSGLKCFRCGSPQLTHVIMTERQIGRIKFGRANSRKEG